MCDSYFIRVTLSDSHFIWLTLKSYVRPLFHMCDSYFIRVTMCSLSSSHICMSHVTVWIKSHTFTFWISPNYISGDSYSILSFSHICMRHVTVWVKSHTFAFWISPIHISGDSYFIRLTLSDSHFICLTLKSTVWPLFHMCDSYFIRLTLSILSFSHICMSHVTVWVKSHTFTFW